MASAEERAMRDAVVPVLREHLPGARIVHELNIDHGQCRADLAAICERHITLVEIKSKHDKLDRLEKQVEVFDRASHDVIVVLDQKFFGPRHVDRLKAMRFSPFSGRAVVWRWPEAAPCGHWELEGKWHFRRYQKRQGVEPHAMRLLELLWREELHAECVRHRISVRTRTSRWPMIEQMAWTMTGKEICEAVCRQLRGRAMAEGDDPL